MKKCVLEDKICIDCGRCEDRCQLDPQKVCNNCFRCLGIDEIEGNAYANIPISGVYLEDEYTEETSIQSENGGRYHFSTLTGARGHYKKNY